tara:strand:- start:37 stop:312 length:276 start_codon:yes stop_codon:yes gene_type:complete
MPIELTKAEVADIIPSIKRYVLEEWEEEIGNLKAELLLNYFIKEIGPYAYNRGVSDAESFFRSKLEDLQGSCHEYELTYWNDNKNHDPTSR